MTDGPFYPPRRWRDALDRPGRRPDARRRRSRAPALGEHLGLRAAGRRHARARHRRRRGRDLAVRRAAGTTATPASSCAAGQFDPGFQGFGAGAQRRQGRRCRSAPSGRCPTPGRTPHIHVKLRHPSFGELDVAAVRRRRPRQCARLPLAPASPPPTARRWR